MCSSVKLFTIDPQTGSGLAVTVPKDRIQKYFPDMAHLLDDKGVISFVARDCEGQDAGKIARVALRFLYTEQYKETPEAQLQQYYAGILYSPLIKLHAEKYLIETLNAQLSDGYLRDVLQAALVGESYFLARACFCILMKYRSYRELVTLLEMMPYRDRADRLIDLACRIKGYSRREPASIAAVRRAYEQQIEELRIVLYHCLDKGQSILKASREELINIDEANKRIAIINGQYQDTLSKITSLEQQFNQDLHQLYQKEAKTLQSWNNSLAHRPNSKDHHSIVPGLTFAETDEGTCLYVSCKTYSDVNMRAMIAELRDALSIASLCVQEQEDELEAFEIFGGEYGNSIDEIV